LVWWLFKECGVHDPRMIERLKLNFVLAMMEETIFVHEEAESSGKDGPSKGGGWAPVKDPEGNPVPVGIDTRGMDTEALKRTVEEFLCGEGGFAKT
jgi:hypothetical protein